MRELGDRRDVDQLERRIARGLEEHEAGRRRRAPPPRRRDRGRRPAPPRPRSAAGARSGCSGRSRTAGAPRPPGRRPRSWLISAACTAAMPVAVAAASSAPSSSARRSSNMRTVGIGDARVRVARLPIGEAVGGVLGAQIAKARGQEQRLGGLAELRAPRCRRGPDGCAGARPRSSHVPPNKNRPGLGQGALRPGLLAACLTWPASRPAQITTCAHPSAAAVPPSIAAAGTRPAAQAWRDV